jgi:signal transduction histidine kinase
MKNYDDAVRYLESAMAVYRIINDTARSKKFILHEREAFVLNKLAEVSKLKGEPEKALKFINTGINNIEDLNHSVNEYDRASYYINAADIFNRLHDPDSAIYYLRKGLPIANQIIHREYIRDAYQQLSLSFAEKKIFDSAYLYNKLFNNIKDSIASESNQREIFQREANLQIARQQARMDRQRLWRNIFIGLTFVLMLFIYLLYNRYRLRQKNRFQTEINKQQQEILRTTIAVQDQERKRIAEDLHDSLGSILSATKLKLSSIAEDNSDNAKQEKLLDTLSLLDEAVAEMKHIAYNIMPATLSRLGLIAALQNLFNRITTKSGLKINYSTHGFAERLNESTELGIYRIVLESINNVVRHAAADNVTVQLVRYPEYINITVEDDGKGFSSQSANLPSMGSGLSNIASRVKNLNGTLDIDSNSGSGTTIVVDIPYT